MWGRGGCASPPPFPGGGALEWGPPCQTPFQTCNVFFWQPSSYYCYYFGRGAFRCRKRGNPTLLPFSQIQPYKCAVVPLSWPRGKRARCPAPSPVPGSNSEFGLLRSRKVSGLSCSSQMWECRAWGLSRSGSGGIFKSPPNTIRTGETAFENAKLCPERSENTLYFRFFFSPGSLLALFFHLPQNLQSLFSLNPCSDHLAGHYRFPSRLSTHPRFPGE